MSLPVDPLCSSLLEAAIEEHPHVAILKYFRFAHLPPALGDVSSIFAEAALRIVELVPPSAEFTVALRKLLEAKDAAVRAAL
jgi:hypothetical protein